MGTLALEGGCQALACVSAVQGGAFTKSHVQKWPLWDVGGRARALLESRKVNQVSPSFHPVPPLCRKLSPRASP